MSKSSSVRVVHGDDDDEVGAEFEDEFDFTTDTGGSLFKFALLFPSPHVSFC